MSTAPNQPTIWTPEFISCIVYRVVMIIVSLAFIWKKYRRPARRIDGTTSPLSSVEACPLNQPSALIDLQLTSLTEEQLVGVILPTYHSPARHVRSANVPSQPTNPSQPSRTQTLRKVISAHLEDIIQSTLGIDDDDGIDIDAPRASFHHAQAESSTKEIEVSSKDGVGLDIEPGDMGLRHRSADGTAENKKSSEHGNLKDIA